MATYLSGGGFRTTPGMDGAVTLQQNRLCVHVEAAPEDGRNFHHAAEAVRMFPPSEADGDARVILFWLLATLLAK